MLPVSALFAEPSREIGGYRVVRTLATGEHSDHLLVHAEDRAWVARVFHPGCPDTIIDHDVAVSDVVRSASGQLSQHVSIVHDLCTTDDGRVALLEEHLAGPRLDALLRARHPRLALGEVVTILAPLVSVIAEGHGLGLTGLLLDTTAVRFRASGAPVVTRRSAARIGPPLPERFRDREPQYEADHAALHSVIEAVAAAVRDEDQPALRAALHRRGGLLDHVLFDLAQPRAVQFETEQPHPVESSAAEPRWVLPAGQKLAASSSREAPTEVESIPLHRARHALVAALDAVGLPAPVVSTVRDGAEATALRFAHLAALFSKAPVTGGRVMRPRFAIAGAAGSVALIVAIMLATQTGTTVARSANEGEPPQSRDQVPSESTRGDDRSPPGQELDLAETELHPEPETWPRLIEQLVARWIACAPSATADCAAAVVHDGSAAATLMTEDDPRHQLLLDWHRASGEAIVVERMGAAVLIDLVIDTTATASLLVVRSEAGWRIRDVIG